MATSKRATKPQPRRSAKKKATTKRKATRKAAKTPRRKVSKPRRLAEVAEAAEAAKAAKAEEETVEKLPAREIVRRPKPEKPKFLNSRSAAVKEKGFALMMSNWVEFAKVPLSYLSEQELKKLFDAEVNGRKRWNIVNRLHSAYNTKRIKRERADLRKRCGLDG